MPAPEGLKERDHRRLHADFTMWDKLPLRRLPAASRVGWKPDHPELVKIKDFPLTQKVQAKMQAVGEYVFRTGSFNQRDFPDGEIAERVLAHVRSLIPNPE